MKKTIIILLKKIFWTFLVFLTIGLGAFFYFIKDLPRPEVFTENELNLATKIYDREGKVILSSIYGEEKRSYVPLAQIPDSLKNAVIATEDENFYTHYGIDFRGIARAIKSNWSSKSLTGPGGSTITQQLIRSTFLTPEKTIERKLKEIILSLELDRRYSKEQILEWYLNQIPFGINLYGAQETSLAYFGKPVQDISLAESAVLAASIQAPSYYSAYGDNVDKLLERKNYVLERMSEEGFISQEEKEKAQNEEIVFTKLPKTLAVHFVEYVKEQIERDYGADVLEIKGLKIYTTLDFDLQKYAEKSVKEGSEKNRAKYAAFNSALIAIDPKTGEILAMVGSSDPWAESLPLGCDPKKTCKFVPFYNVATQGLRQPGSSIKPLIYAEAFREGWTDTTIIIDEPTDFGDYAPNNYDGIFRGAVTTRSALAQSLNIPAVKTLQFAGLNDTLELAKKMGLTTINNTSDYGLSFALGAGDVKLIDLTSAFSVFANGGYHIEPSAILRIEDSKGNIIYKNNKTPRKVLEKNTCDLITDILSDNNARAPMFGQNSALRFDNPRVSVKTGTTQSNNDGWTVGYSSDICIGVWSGNNDHSSMKGGIGLTTSGPIWRSVMLKAIEIEETMPVEELDSYYND